MGGLAAWAGGEIGRGVDGGVGGGVLWWWWWGWRFGLAVRLGTGWVVGLWRGCWRKLWVCTEAVRCSSSSSNGVFRVCV